MKLRLFWTGLACGILLTLLAVNAKPIAAAASDEAVTADETDAEADATEGRLVYELRTYHTPDGKLDALHARFRDHTMKIFEKHGMKNVIYLTPNDQDNTLVYLIAHKSEDAAEASWKAFSADPEWKRVAAASRKDGRLVEKVERMFLTPTDYSPLK